MILGITGHRPDKLPNKQTGYKLPNPTYKYVCQQLEKYFLELKPEKILTGMALGADQYSAVVAIRLGIPFVAVKPFEDQEIKWPKESQIAYHKLLNKAAEIVVVSPGGYTGSKMQIRNKWIVDYCDLLLACHDGSSGGTQNCINYAESIRRRIIKIDPRLTPAATAL